ncbi:MAG TPA: serine/threonine-protein kinase, partial [Streptosporangiaceae bacterium]|nr:serine/threonine-protein kinase [Streptosporangiaceae bacterium]
MPLSPLRPGDPQQLGSYEILGRLGAGGQGVVYLGQIPDGERVAIKVLHHDVDEAFLIRELAMMRQVASFCTARVLDAQVTGNTWYIVSEYIEGRSLADVVDHDGPITGGSLERLAVGTVTALTAIHKAGVVHRDFKPANILLGPDGPRVIDFGIARTLDLTTTAGEIRGTPAYMAPEQINGQTAGTAADMFAWAATMGYAGTGRSPFGSDTLPAIIMRVLQEQPELHELTGTLHEMAMACLAKDPAARPTAQEVLIRLLGHAPAAPMQALRQGTVLAANVNLPSAAANLQPPAPPAPQAHAHLAPADYSPPASYPSPSGYSPPAAYPPAGSPPAPPWPGGGQPPMPPRQRSSTFTRVVAPIAAVVIVAVGAVVGLALTGAFSSAKHGSAPTTTPVGTSVSPTQTRPTPTHTRPARTHVKPAPPPNTPAPVQTTPAPVPTSPAPIPTTPPPTGN